MGTIKCREENLRKSLPVLNEMEFLDKIVVVPQEPQYSLEDIEALRSDFKYLNKVEFLHAKHPDIKSINKLAVAVEKYGENDYITLDDDIAAWADDFIKDLRRFYEYTKDYPENVVAVDAHKTFILRNKHTGKLLFYQDATNDFQKVCREISFSASVSWLCYYPHRMFKDNTDLLDYDKIKRVFTFDTSKLKDEWDGQFDGSIKFLSHDEMWFAAIAVLKGVPTYYPQFYPLIGGYGMHRAEIKNNEALAEVISNRNLVMEVNKRINDEFPELGNIFSKTTVELFCKESDLHNVDKFILNVRHKDSRKINVHIV